MKKLLPFILFWLTSLAFQCFSQATGLPVADKPSGGAVSPADFSNASTWNFQQTTAGQTISVPDMSPATSAKNIVVRHIGSASFSLSATGVSSLTINPGEMYLMQWNGASYSTQKYKMSGPEITAALGYTPGSGTVTSVGVSSSNLTVSGTVTTSGSLNVSLPNTGVSAGTYEFITVDATGRVTAAYNSSSSALGARSLSTPYQASNTARSYDLQITVSIAIGAGLISTSNGQIVLEISANGSSGWIEHGRSQNINSGVLAAQNTQVCQISALDIPAGYYWRLTPTTNGGTVTPAYISGREILRR